MTFSFQAGEPCPGSDARVGRLHTGHSTVETPVFMPVGTQGTVKSLAPADLQDLGASIILANTYHLYLRPGESLVAAAGGLHRFASWPGAILTDSGGFQVFSLDAMRQISDEGVVFRSHLDDAEHFFTPERAIAVQEQLGADIIMAFDECPAFGASRAYHEDALERTHRWAKRCMAARRRDDQALFGITQGGTYADLRVASARFLADLDLPGYAIGGLSVGEPKELMWTMVEGSTAELPRDKPRYLMGVGTPEDLIMAVDRGIDMLDSVMPTRIARNGALFTRSGRCNVRNARFRDREGPIEPDCDCYACCTFDVAYLHHLFRCEELLAYRLATIHNLRHMVRLAADLRLAIAAGRFASARESLLAGYLGADSPRAYARSPIRASAGG